MAKQNSMLAIKWSVWDMNPLVSWSWEGGVSTIAMKMPPISVANLAEHHVIAIVGNYSELGAGNLRFYSYGGDLIKTYSAPDLGESSQFGAIRESGNGLEVTVGYQDKDNGRWIEVAGKLNPDDGSVSGMHRNY